MVLGWGVKPACVVTQMIVILKLLTLRSSHLPVFGKRVDMLICFVMLQPSVALAIVSIGKFSIGLLFLMVSNWAG